MKKYAYLVVSIALLACSSKVKSFNKNQIAMSKIYGRWQLISIIDKTTNKKQDVTDKNLLVTFTTEQRLQFNLDVNSCEGKFTLVGSDGITMNATDFVCTQACCDTIRINYAAVKRYEVKGKILRLFSENEVLELKAL